MDLTALKIEAYKKSVEFADKILFLTGGTECSQGILTELFREEAVTLSMNVAAGAGRKNKLESGKFYAKALEACSQCEALIVFLEKENFMGYLISAALKAELGKIKNMIMRQMQEKTCDNFSVDRLKS